MELINKDTIDAIQAALAPVADKIGQGATYVWTTVVTQQYVYGIADLIWAVAALVGAGAAGFFSSKFMKLAKENPYDMWEIPAIFLGIAAFGLPVVGIICLTQGVMHIINPSYYALQFFLTLGKAAAN